MLMVFQNVIVRGDFDTLLEEKVNGEKGRGVGVTHGGVLFEAKKTARVEQDLGLEFENDPMTKLKRFAVEQRLRLVDVLRQFDRDHSNTLSKDEFIKGILVRHVHCLGGTLWSYLTIYTDPHQLSKISVWVWGMGMVCVTLTGLGVHQQTLISSSGCLLTECLATC